MDSEYIKFLTEKYNIDLFVHGDDPCLDSQGRDVYAQVKAEGRFRTVKRTEGVSSTELVGRMLLMTKDHLRYSLEGVEKVNIHTRQGLAKLDREKDKKKDPDDGSHQPTLQSFGTHVRKTRVSRLLPTTRRISQFSEGQAPKPGDKVVYIDGSWDMFHPGHTEILR